MLVYGKILSGSSYADLNHALKKIFHLQEKFVNYMLQPIPEIYFGPRVQGEQSKHGDLYSVNILIGISGLICFLALTNFVNLTTLTLPALWDWITMRHEIKNTR